MILEDDLLWLLLFTQESKSRHFLLQLLSSVASISFKFAKKQTFSASKTSLIRNKPNKSYSHIIWFSLFWQHKKAKTCKKCVCARGGGAKISLLWQVFCSIFLIIFYILVQGCMSIKHLWAELTKSLIKAQRKFQVILLFIALEDSHTVTKLEMKRVTEDAKN